MHIDKVYPYKLLPKYPGMRPNDEVIWDDFVQKHPDAFISVYYNVLVGDPVLHEEHRSRMDAVGMTDVSRWAIDALAYDGEQEYIIEIKPNAGASALGQARAYRALMHAEGRVSEKAVPVVLTDAISPITEKAARLLNVMLLIP